MRNRRRKDEDAVMGQGKGRSMHVLLRRNSGFVPYGLFGRFYVLLEMMERLAEVIIANIIEMGSGLPFPQFFQVNRNGDPKGIIVVKLGVSV